MFLKNDKKIIEIVSFVAKLASLIFIFLFIFGFICWNIYLNKFNFHDYSLLQIRYLSAGFWFLLVLGILSTPLIFKKNKISKKLVFLYLCFFPIYITYFPTLIFPLISSSFGGGNPTAIQIIGRPDEINFLKNFNIDGAGNGEGLNPVQTLPLCLLYESDEALLLGVIRFEKDIPSSPARIISLKKNNFSGIQTLGGDLKKFINICKAINFYNL